jgi:hypothetical protein
MGSLDDDTSGMTCNQLIGIALNHQQVTLAEMQPLIVETNTFRRTSLSDMKITCSRCSDQYRYIDRIDH